MNIIDSSGWLEFFLEGQNAENFAPVIYDRQKLLVSVISIYEVHRFTAKKLDMKTLAQTMNLMHQGIIADTNSDIAIAASEYSAKYKLALADALIYATARHYDATLWTQDADHKDLPNVKYFPKLVP